MPAAASELIWLTSFGVLPGGGFNSSTGCPSCWFPAAEVGSAAAPAPVPESTGSRLSGS